MIDDIPEAIRDTTSASKSSPSFFPLTIGGLIAIGMVAFLVVLFSSSLTKPPQKQVSQPLAQVAPKQPVVNKSSPQAATPTQPPTPSIPVEPENLLGHLPYDEAPTAELEPVTADGQNRLRSAAAAKFKQMEAAAQAEGINLVLISAFRSVAAQEKIFFEVKEQRVQATTKRAEVSAPPGHSEHHTGYAVDLGDGNAPHTHLEPEFEQTAAFKWLQANAPKYSFELSFPRNNPQGISYEPWHWRFVGDRHSLETFYKARNS